MPSPTRRQFLSLLGTASVGLAGCLSEDNGEFGQIDGEWPVEGANARRTRTVNDGPADPAMVWATEIEEARAVGTPVVADQTKVPSLADTRVYVLADAVSSPARHRYRLHAFDAPTGEEHWRVPLRSDPNSPPAVDSGQIFVSAQRGIEQGRLVAFEDRFGTRSGCTISTPESLLHRSLLVAPSISLTGRGRFTLSGWPTDRFAGLDRSDRTKRVEPLQNQSLSKTTRCSWVRTRDGLV
ncbi:hypothetical protein HBNXHr_1722 [Halorhabdus sp. BNX81]|nr:hypothetical protein HBNXHr_1722 [Halorhabdus sp. BNX81]